MKLAPVCAALICVSLISCATPSPSTTSSPPESSSNEQEFTALTPDAVLAKLGAYLPYAGGQNVSGLLPGFEQDDCITPDGNIGELWLWAQFEGGDTFAHDAQFVVQRGRCAQYAYKNYSLNLTPLPEPLTLEEGLAMAQNFADDFIVNDGALSFVAEPLPNNHVYDPGVVESYVTRGGGFEYEIMVDLVYGYVREFDEHPV